MLEEAFNVERKRALEEGRRWWRRCGRPEHVAVCCQSIAAGSHVADVERRDRTSLPRTFGTSVAYASAISQLSGDGPFDFNSNRNEYNTNLSALSTR